MALTTTLVTYKYDKEGVVRRARGSISGTYTASSVNSATAASTTAAATGGIANQRAVDDVLIASGVMTITLGFVPSHVFVLNMTDRVSQEWFAGMNSGDFLESNAGSTKSLETDDKLVVNTTTGVVTITADGGAFTDNDTMIWYAED